jgi:hypothetical protein
MSAITQDAAHTANLVQRDLRKRDGSLEASQFTGDLGLEG